MTLKKLLLPISLLAAAQANSLSLDEAVNAQLALGPLPCAELLDGFADNTGRFSGGLLSICSAVIPAGAVASSGGGGAATPISTPTAMQEIASVGHGEEKSTSKNVVSTSIARNWSLFFTAEAESLDRDSTDFEHGYDSDRRRIVSGITFSANPKAVYSFALDYSRQDGDFSDNDGEFERDSKGIRFLASFRPTENTFVSLLIGRDSIDAKHERSSDFSYLFNNSPVLSVSGTPEADYDYDQDALSIQAGYDFQRGNYTITPTLGLNWNESDYGTYSETGNSGLELTFYDDKETSLQSTLGVAVSASFGRDYGTISPQFGVTWHHEFDDDQRTAEVSFTGDSFNERFEYQTEEPDRNFFNVSAGVVFVFKGGVQAFANVQSLVGHDFYDSYTLSLGLRKEL